MLAIYDSGIGGVAVLEKLITIQPNLNFIYLADQSFFPLGEKSKNQIISRLHQVFDYFISKGVDEVLLACNTASTIFQTNINEFHQFKDTLKVLTITSPTINLIKQKYSHLQNKKGVVIATTVTINSRIYQDNLPDFTSLKYSFLPSLASSIEAQDYGKIRETLLNNSQLSWSSLDFIVLGCTHYTWIKPIFHFLNPNLQVIDPVTELTGTLISSLKANTSSKPIQKFVSTGKKIKLTNSNYKFKCIKL